MLRLVLVRRNAGSAYSPSAITEGQVMDVVQDRVPDQRVLALIAHRDRLNESRLLAVKSSRTGKPGRYTVLDEDSVEVEL